MSRALSRFLVVTLATLLATGWLTAKPQPAAAAGSGTISITGTGAITESFDTLAVTGTANTTLPSGWFLNEAGSSGANNDAYAAGSGTSNAGDTYSFGAGTAAERAFGQLLSGTLTPTIGAAFTNDTGSTIVALDVSYAGEGWRLGADPLSGTTPRGADRLDFQLSLDATSLTTGAWADVNDLDFVSPLGGTAGARDGNLASNRTGVTASVGGLSIPEGATFWIRWSDFNVSNADDGLAIDDFALRPTVDDTITLSIDDVSQAESDSGSTGFRFTVSLSGPAGPGGVTFDVSTEDGTAESTGAEDYSTTNLADRTIAEGEASTTFSVPVTGDTVFEPDETFFVNITGVTGAVAADGRGQGTIENDDEGDPCTQPFTPIYSIQGTTNNPALTGDRTTQGIVVGDFEGPDEVGFLGFYIQDRTGDGNTATSDGIYVFTNQAIKGVSVGDEVRVTGFARNRFNETTISGANDNNVGVPVENILICSSGNPLPAPVDVTLPVTAVTDFEKYEGMRVRFPQSLVIAEYFNYDRFGELVLALPLPGETRPFTGTAIDEPGVGASPANQRTAANLLRRITLDDGLNDGNPEVTRHPNGNPFSLTNRFRGGDKVQNAIGVLGFAFSQFRIQPTGPAEYTSVNPRVETAPDPGGSLRVAAMNTLNFFVTPDIEPNPEPPNPPDPADNLCGGNGGLECRGWDSNQPDELTRQRDKLVRALAGIDADVLGLNELENSPVADPLTDPEGIVPALNAFLEDDVYAAIETGVIGTDAIRVGMIYKPDVVEPIGDFAVLDSSVDPRFVDTRSRPALAQTFEEIATGARFTVVVNHLKSKGSACTDDPDVPNDFSDPDIGDGQGNCNLTRKAAAEALIDWIADDPTGSGDPDFLIIGDLNSYAMEDPIDVIKAGDDGVPGTDDDWTNLIAQDLGAFAYSFVFDGQAGYLDHALANPSIADQVAGAEEWHINADEPDILDYDTSFKSDGQDAIYVVDPFRTSDHDPVLVGLTLVNDAPTIDVSAGTACTVAGGVFELAIDDTEVAAGDLTLSLEDNSNPDLVTGVTFGGSGASRSVAITVAGTQAGSATLTIGVDDGFQTTTTTISVTVGTDAEDALAGGSGADLLIGRQGIDTLSGAGGADVLCGGQAADALSGGEGDDAIDGGQGADVVSGGGDDDSLVGGLGSDSLSGDAGDDTLTGNAGADAFSGGAGSDTITDLTPSQGDTSDGT